MKTNIIFKIQFLIAFLFFNLVVSQNRFAGIEIGSKGVKVTVIEVKNVKKGIYEIKDFWTENVGIAKGISVNGNLAQPDIDKACEVVFANYQSQITNAQGTSLTPFFYGTGVRKEIGNHTLGIFYLVPGITDLTVIDTKIHTSAIDMSNKASFDARYFIQLTYAYKFNKGKAVKKVTRNTEVESDTKKGAIAQ